MLLCDFGLSRTLQTGGNKKNKQKFSRSLSPHVVTRNYRPPEVILLQSHYNDKVDMWSAGTTALELFKYSK